jgi:hypothetical protein
LLRNPEEISCLGVTVERPSLEPPKPDSDQFAGNVMSAGEGVVRLARDELLSDLPFEFDAVGAVLGHGLHPLKARRSRSIPNLLFSKGSTTVSSSSVRARRKRKIILFILSEFTISTSHIDALLEVSRP